MCMYVWCLARARAHTHTHTHNHSHDDIHTQGEYKDNKLHGYAVSEDESGSQYAGSYEEVCVSSAFVCALVLRSI